MKNIGITHKGFATILCCFLMIFSIVISPRIACAISGDVISGPYSLTIRGGGQNDSSSIGLDARADFLDPRINIHLFGTYDLLDAGNGIGEIDNQRYGAGLALSHTYPARANAFIGISFIHELSKDFGHAYLGGKYKVADNAFLSGSYGFGFGSGKEIKMNSSWLLLAESVDWLKLGGVIIGSNKLKGNAYYYLTDPGDENISGIEGELSYPMTESMTIGIKGSSDLTSKDHLEKNWQSYLFLTYAFGYQKGSLIEIALDKNNPVEYPKILRTTERIEKKKSSGPPEPTTLSVSISPPGGNVVYCMTEQQTDFTAIPEGGTPPYSYVWTVTDDSFSVTDSDKQTVQICSPSYYGATGVLQVTVTDSKELKASRSVEIDSPHLPQ